jgi:hypothetical protein
MQRFLKYRHPAGDLRSFVHQKGPRIVMDRVVFVLRNMI